MVEEGRPPLDDRPVDLDLAGGQGGEPREENPAASPGPDVGLPMPGATGSPAVGDLWLSGLAGEPPPPGRAGREAGR